MPWDLVLSAQRCLDHILRLQPSGEGGPHCYLQNSCLAFSCSHKDDRSSCVQHGKSEGYTLRRWFWRVTDGGHNFLPLLGAGKSKVETGCQSYPVLLWGNSNRMPQVQGSPVAYYRRVVQGNCPAVEVAPGPNWVPCQVLDGYTRQGSCVPRVSIETTT